jgi:hypothetical protein
MRLLQAKQVYIVSSTCQVEWGVSTGQQPLDNPFEGWGILSFAPAKLHAFALFTALHCYLLTLAWGGAIFAFTEHLARLFFDALALYMTRHQHISKRR